MADVEQRAEAEATAKGLSGQARKSYIGGVFNKIREAHARAIRPGQGKTFLSNLNRRNRQLARARYHEALRPHEEAVAALKAQRKGELAQLSYEKSPTPRKEEQAAPPTPTKPPRDAFPARDRQIRDAVKHGAPDFPPGVGQPKPKPAAKPEQRGAHETALTPRPLTEHDRSQIEQRLRQHRTSTGQTPSLDSPTMSKPAWFYRELYGEGQTRAALNRLTTANLRETAITSGVASSGTRAQLLDRLEAGARAAAQGKPAEKPAQPAAMTRPAEEPKKLSYREEQFRRKHQFKFEQGERDRARKAEQEARYQRNLELKRHGYQWSKVPDIGGPSDNGDTIDMVWQLYDADGKPISEAEALRRIRGK